MSEQEPKHTMNTIEQDKTKAELAQALARLAKIAALCEKELGRQRIYSLPDIYDLARGHDNE